MRSRHRADVTDGVASAVRHAKQAAGDANVFVMGGANVIDQCIAGGLADEVRIHLSPVLLGGGTRLFASVAGGPIPLQIECTVHTPTATHLTYRLAS